GEDARAVAAAGGGVAPRRRTTLMAADAVALHGFAYGEVLEGPNRRSLGYRLLAPAGPVAWGPEVESLARRLQAAPYPDSSPPVLPLRVWGEGVLLFAATAPSDPDHHLGLLQQGTAANWQWLPLVGADFPLPSYARRGPVIAWTPHLAGVAVKLGQSSGDES